MSASASEVRLDCPLCGTQIWCAPGEPDLSACPGCGATLIGAADDPRSAVGRAADHLGLDVDREALARGIFAVGPGHDLEGLLAITSDSRDGFYRWWVVVGGPTPAETLSRAAR